MRKPAFGVSAQVRHKHRRWLEALNFGLRKRRDCSIFVAENALISCADTAQLICAFVFAYAKIGFLITRLILKMKFQDDVSSESDKSLKSDHKTKF